MANKILIVVDMQEDFVGGSLGTLEAQAIVSSVVKKVEEYANNGDCIIFTKDTHHDNYLETNEGRHLPVSHCIKGTKGWELIPELKSFVEKYDSCFVVEKGTFGSCVDLPNLINKLDDISLSKGEIELIGLCTDICVVSNALILKANFPEYVISVDSKCCAGVTPETHQAALATMKMCQIEVL